jgi:hypothetical protein
MSATLDESADRHEWTLSGHRVTQLCIDQSSCRIQSWSLRESLEIRFGGPFQLSLPDGTSREIDPEAAEQLAPLLTVVGREILRLTITRSGTLEAWLSDGSFITSASHARHDAFEVSGGGALEGLTYVARRDGRAPWPE